MSGDIDNKRRNPDRRPELDAPEQQGSLGNASGRPDSGDLFGHEGHAESKPRRDDIGHRDDTSNRELPLPVAHASQLYAVNRPFDPLPSALCLRPPPSALCPPPSALRPLPSALFPLPSALCPLPSAVWAFAS